jgi:hypothetical protein
MDAYWGSGGIAPRILDPGTRWRLVVSFTPRRLYPYGKSPWCTLDRRLGGPQSRSGCCIVGASLNEGCANELKLR